MPRTAALQVVVVLCLVAAPLAALDCAKSSLGEPGGPAESTPVAAVLDAPDAWIGKRVRVEGEAAAVCQKAGCWIEIRESAGTRALRVKVEDGEIVFPKESVGRRVAAFGVVEAWEMSRAKYERYRRHEAEETGEPFDPATLGPGPFRVLQVRGEGAELCGAAG